MTAREVCRRPGLARAEGASMHVTGTSTQGWLPPLSALLVFLEKIRLPLLWVELQLRKSGLTISIS